MSDLDVEELCRWLNQQKCYVSINPLVPKKLTELSYYKFDTEKIKKQAEIVKKNLKVKYKIANINNSYEEYIAGI